MIRKITESDIDQIIEIEKDAFGKSLGKSFFENELINPLAHYLVVESNGFIAGYIGSWFSFGLIEIINFVVEESYRNKGYGSLLMDQLIKDGLDNKMESIILDVKETNKDAIRFYKKYGFFLVSIRKKYYEDETDALNFEKKLVK